MSTELRDSTKEDLGLARKFADEIGEPFHRIVKMAEEMGFRVIYKVGAKKHLPILIPSKKVLDWDFDARSLDLLGGMEDQVFRNACSYLGLITEAYLREQGISF
jgi:hypothetical protein